MPETESISHSDLCFFFRWWNFSSWSLRRRQKNYQTETCLIDATKLSDRFFTSNRLQLINIENRWPVMGGTIKSQHLIGITAVCLLRVVQLASAFNSMYPIMSRDDATYSGDLNRFRVIYISISIASAYSNWSRIITKLYNSRFSDECMSSHRKVSNWLIIHNGRESSTLTTVYVTHTHKTFFHFIFYFACLRRPGRFIITLRV